MNLCQIISDLDLYILRSASGLCYFRRVIEAFPLRRILTCFKHQMEQDNMQTSIFVFVLFIRNALMED